MKLPAWIVALVPYPLVGVGVWLAVAPGWGFASAGFLWWIDLQIETVARSRASRGA